MAQQDDPEIVEEIMQLLQTGTALTALPDMISVLLNRLTIIPDYDVFLARMLVRFIPNCPNENLDRINRFICVFHVIALFWPQSGVLVLNAINEILTSNVEQLFPPSRNLFFFIISAINHGVIARANLQLGTTGLTAIGIPFTGYLRTGNYEIGESDQAMLTEVADALVNEHVSFTHNAN